jgi:hypothetical protein
VAERAQKIARDEPPRDPVAAAQNPPPKVVTIGTPDAAEAALIRHGELCALEGRFNQIGLASIAAPADALAAEIARGRPASETLH